MILRVTALFLTLVAFSACDPLDPVDPPEVCEATLDPSDARFNRYEGTFADNYCEDDSDCQLGGCSSEVCAAEATFTTCEVVPMPAGNCGCVENECIWHLCQ